MPASGVPRHFRQRRNDFLLNRRRMRVQRLRRRDLLKLAAGLPVLSIPRISRAATPAFGAADHLLILFAQGGFRSHATFNAVGTMQHNPWGTQEAQTGTEWKLGHACGARDIVTS